MKSKIIVIILIIATILFGLVFYSRYISTSGLIVKEYRIEKKNIPSHFDGIKIVHFSDLHYGRTIFNKDLINIVKEINLIKPDIVIFTGDLIDSDYKSSDSEINDIIDEFNKIDSTLGKYIIRGNHDYVQKNAYKKIISEINFIELNNTYDIIYKDNLAPIYIAGVDTISYKKDNINASFEYFNEDNINNLFKILIMHEPDKIDNYLKTDKIDLVLAGHSHNGQVVIPFIGPLTTPMFAKKYYSEHYTIGECDLYISSGIGVSKVNFRFMNRPSINFYRLVNK